MASFHACIQIDHSSTSSSVAGNCTSISLRSFSNVESAVANASSNRWWNRSA